MKTLDDLKREEKDPNAPIEEMLRNEGWNDCIDHLHSQGLLMVWNTDMESAPRDGTSFLLYKKNNTDKNYTVVQASYYEGRLYPDSKEDIIDWDDGILYPTAWMPLPKYEVTK